MSNGLTDAVLVGRTLSGDPSAYGELARRWAGRVIAVCHARTGSADAAEDLAQEALLRGFRFLESLKQHRKFGGWLSGIAVRTCLDWLKARQRSQVSLGSLGGEGVDPQIISTECDGATRAENRDEVRRLMAEVERLPLEYREVLLIYYYDEVTYREVAEMLDVSVATVNARLTKARSMLRERMSAVRRYA